MQFLATGLTAAAHDAANTESPSRKPKPCSKSVGFDVFQHLTDSLPSRYSARPSRVEGSVCEEILGRADIHADVHMCIYIYICFPYAMVRFGMI